MASPSAVTLPAQSEETLQTERSVVELAESLLVRRRDKALKGGYGSGDDERLDVQRRAVTGSYYNIRGDL